MPIDYSMRYMGETVGTIMDTDNGVGQSTDEFDSSNLSIIKL